MRAFAGVDGGSEVFSRRQNYARLVTSAVGRGAKSCGSSKLGVKETRGREKKVGRPRAMLEIKRGMNDITELQGGRKVKRVERRRLLEFPVQRARGHSSLPLRKTSSLKIKDNKLTTTFRVDSDIEPANL